MFPAREPAARVQRHSLGKLVDQSTVLLMLSIGSLILLLSMLILFHQNTNATKGYNLRTLERERSQLLLDEEVIEMEIAKAQALEKLASDKRVQVMVAPRNPQYITVDATVARVANR